MTLLNQMVLDMIRLVANGGIPDAYIDGFEEGELSIENGELSGLNEFYRPNTWIAITGSDLNDAIYQIAKPTFEPLPPEISPETHEIPPYKLSNGSNNDNPTEDEELFYGTIYRLKLPSGFVNLAREITAWVNDPKNAPTNVVSQSETVVNLHSWSKKTGTTQDGNPLTWEDVFSKRLKQFPRIMFHTVTM